MTRPIRVLVPYMATFFGGVRQLLGLGMPLLSRAPGFRVTYSELCSNDADMDAMERAGVEVDRHLGVPGPGALSMRGGWRRGLDIAAQAPRLARIAWRMAARLSDYDICYVHGHRELLLAIAARAAARLPRPPAIVWHWHGPPLSVAADARNAEAARLLVRLASPSCARVIAISDFSAGEARDMGVDPERLVTVLNAASVSEDASGATAPQPLPARSADQVTLLLPCAAIRRHKGVHLAVEALRHVSPDSVLWITGDPADPLAAEYVDELRKMAARAQVSDRVHFIDARRDLHRVMSSADIVLVPSVWQEPFGLVAAEAQLLGVPVIASNRGALPELMGNGRLGLVFDAEDPATLATAINRMSRDPDLRARIASAARTHAELRYSYERWSRELASVLGEVADRRRIASLEPAQG
ncbi:MAG: glycosyltransferase family 4 protein [Deltaproteobacteria bacterium]|nr:glycosyltransferase family 4 protein [Deltaproteobacteria bacterium]